MQPPEVRFIGIDPDTPGNKCPSVSIDERTGDFLFQGWTVTDTETLATIAKHSPIADDESIVRLPARMARIIAEACQASANVR
jgi:hypothetical protein